MFVKWELYTVLKSWTILRMFTTRKKWIQFKKDKLKNSE